LNINDYKVLIKEATDAINPIAIEKSIDLILQTCNSHNTIFLAGNGGSAASANHFACDMAKNLITSDGNRFKTISVSASAATLTALGNDTGYENIFSEQLKLLMNKGDILIAISASGNSPNIVKACEEAKKMNNRIIGLSGFTGGKLKELSDISFYVNSPRYEVVEDLHSIIMHGIISCFKSKFEKIIS